MTIENVCPINGETLAEERINFFTHLAGLILSFIGWIVLLLWTWRVGDTWHLVGSSIYGATLVLLYGASTYYHACQSISRKKILQIVDHACIYLLIAGTYTPFSLGPLREAGGLDMLYLEWGIAVIGVAFKVFAVNRFWLLSILAYLGMGWLVVFNFPILIEELPFTAIVWMVAGGLIYTSGTLFFLWEALPFNHAIWHLFVLGGSVCHYCSIFYTIEIVK